MAGIKQTNVEVKAEYFGVKISQDNKVLYNGPCKLDVAYAKIPKQGKFEIELEHANKQGFAKMFHHFVASADVLGIQAILPKLDKGTTWYDLALTGKGIPAKVTVVMDNYYTASVMLYTLSIPTIVPGNWHDTTQDKAESVANILHHAQESGLKNLCDVGTKGGKILTSKGEYTSGMLVQFLEAKKALESLKRSIGTSKAKKAEDVKPTNTKKPSKPRTKKEPKPTLSPEQAKLIQDAREKKE